MFERYSEGARRVIFFARWEASRFGASEIGAEHLLLGVLRQSSLVGEASREIREEIEQSLQRQENTSMSVDLPLSTPAKRALAYGAEESVRTKHQHLGVEHLLLGLMRESEPITALLQRHGVDSYRILREIPPEPEQEQPNREGLHALVDKLPETAFGRAKGMLERMQNRPPIPPSAPVPFPETVPGVLGGFGGGGGHLRAGGWRRSATRVDDGAEVYETQHFYRGHEITLIERYRMSEDGQKLTYSLEIDGPGKTIRHTIDFDVSPS